MRKKDPPSLSPNKKKVSQSRKIVDEFVTTEVCDNGVNGRMVFVTPQNKLMRGRGVQFGY